MFLDWCSQSEVENLNEKIGAKSHILMNGKTVLDLGEKTPGCVLTKPKEYDTQISKETQMSAIIDSDEFSEDDDGRERQCIWQNITMKPKVLRVIFLVKNIYFLFVENVYKVAGQQCD